MDYLVKDCHPTARRSLLRIKWLVEVLEWYCLRELYEVQVLEDSLKDKFRLAKDIFPRLGSENSGDVKYLQENEFLGCGVRVKCGDRGMLGGCVEEVFKKRNKDHKNYVVAFLGGDEEMMNKEMIEECFHRNRVGLMG